MGKRKKASKPPPKKSKETLDTVFQCLFCNHEKSVSVKMEKKLGVGQLSCKVCGQHFQTGINYLSAPVDVYSEWIDACDAVAKDAAGATRMTGAPPMQKLDKIRQDGHEGSTGEMDDFIEVDEADAEGEFAEE